MNVAQTMLLNQMITDFENTYVEFLDRYGLMDSAATKAGFYAAAEAVVEADPVYEKELQQALSQYLGYMRTESVENIHEEVSMLFQEVAARKPRPHALIANPL